MTTLFTRITLNPVHPDVKHALRSPEAMHAIIAAATEGSNRPLWRLDNDRVYVLSDTLDQNRITARLGHPVIESTDYDCFLKTIHSGTTFVFDIAANASVKKNQKRTTIINPQEQVNWLTRKLTASGTLTNLFIDSSCAMQFQRKGRKVTLNKTIFKGTLTVTDETAIKHTLLNGIGSSKAYGCGLLLPFGVVRPPVLTVGI